MRLLKVASIAVFIMLLTSCSKTIEPELPSDSKAAFAFEGSIYSIQRGKVSVENIENEIGEIKIIVDDITEDGDAIILDSTLNLNVGDKIYKVKGTDRNFFVAIKIDDTFYGALQIKFFKLNK